jgi:transglutaminase/protease-like cytokinesis protein 3
MKKFKLKKILVPSLVVISLIGLNPIGVSAKWKSNSKGWWYTEGKSYVTGWELIEGNWYYFYSDGYMAKDTTIDGYYVNGSGVWTNDISASNAKLSLDSLGQEILNNISIQNPKFYVEYTGNINNAGDAIQDEIDKLKYTNSYESYNVSSYDISMSSWSNSTIVNVEFNCEYRMTATMANDLDTRARVIVSNITSDNMSLADKERVIHDWIINNTQYDQSYSIYDPYNTLINHTGVCEGYTLLAQKMFTIAGIDSLVIEGYGDGVSHAWNLVYIDNKWHHVDLTWDDPVSSEDVLRYDYYNLSDSEISIDHTWDTSKYPKTN